jgi:hypothetical protein
MTHDNADPLFVQPEISEARRANVEEQILKHAVVRLNGHILGFVIGVIAALGIFVATNWLVFKGGDVIGPHLGLLGNFFIGYSVTFLGSFIGAIYNGVVFLRTPKSRR